MKGKQDIRDGNVLPLCGNLIFLREIALSDVTDRYLAWMNDASVNKYLESRFGVHTLDSLESFVRGRIKSDNEWMFAICVKESGLHIGNIKLGPVNAHHGFGDIGLLVGESDWQGQGVATEAIGLVADFAFNVLGLRRLAAGMYSENKGSFRAFQKCGFSLEGTMREMYRSEGQFQDGYRMGLLKGDWVK